jgi:pyruvate dehydrogenase E2 component (dihydrolipoamide acetyltransferase)
VQLAAPARVLLASAGRIEVVDATASRGRVLATPATRRLARQLGVELGAGAATGKRGRVTTDDVKQFAAPRCDAAATETRAAAGLASRHHRASSRSASRCAACASASRTR